MMLELVVAYQPVQAQSCTVDPLGSEVCLPDSTPEEPDQPDKPKKSNQSNKPKQTVIVPQCFGPCTQFPPAPPYRQFQKEVIEEVAPDATPVPITEAETYLERTLDRNDMAQVNTVGIEADTDADGMVVTMDGLSYREVVEPHSLLFTNELNAPG